MKKITKALAAIMLTVVVAIASGCTPQENNDSDVKVTTYSPQGITNTSVVCGGDVIVPQGLTLNELGVCWSIHSNPTVEDNSQSTSNWSEPFVCAITSLEPNTQYHIRAYALRGLEYYYGDDKSFTTKSDDNGGDDDLNGHDYVDLGLPSGTLWATCNLGAETPEDGGDFFAWGETALKTTYNWSTYKYCRGGGGWNTLTKYCNYANYGYNGYIDILFTLLPEDDAATAQWGDSWSIPTESQWRELIDNTTNVWTTQNGVSGRLFTANNGNTLFLPASGSWSDDELVSVGNRGCYWSNSRDTEDPSTPLPQFKLHPLLERHPIGEVVHLHDALGLDGKTQTHVANRLAMGQDV